MLSSLEYIGEMRTLRGSRPSSSSDIITLFSPTWSPDNSKLAFTGISYSGKSDIYIVDFEDGKLERLTNDFFDDRDPVWAHEGHFIYFSSDRTIFDDRGNESDLGEYEGN